MIITHYGLFVYTLLAHRLQRPGEQGNRWPQASAALFPIAGRRSAPLCGRSLVISGKGVEENRHPLIFLYNKYDIFVKKGEENGSPPVFLYTKIVFSTKSVEENSHPLIFLYIFRHFLEKSVEENRHPPVFLYTYVYFVIKGVEENGDPLIFLYTRRAPKPKPLQPHRKGDSVAPLLSPAIAVGGRRPP